MCDCGRTYKIYIINYKSNIPNLFIYKILSENGPYKYLMWKNVINVLK